MLKIGEKNNKNIDFLNEGKKIFMKKNFHFFAHFSKKLKKSIFFITVLNYSFQIFISVTLVFGISQLGVVCPLKLHLILIFFGFLGAMFIILSHLIPLNIGLLALKSNGQISLDKLIMVSVNLLSDGDSLLIVK